MNFGIARGMARLILDPYSLPGTVPEATESEVVRWILDKARGSSPMSDSDSAVRTSLDREIAMVVSGIGPSIECPAFRKCTMSPPAATTLTVTIGPEAAIPASCIRTLIATHPRGEGDLNPRAQSALD